MGGRARRRPGGGARLAKGAVDGGLDGTLEEGLAIEREAFAAVFRTEDAAIGVRSFTENGPGKATFVGR
jgi:enoyl-CoA hydratase/carnithine racemase